MWNSKCLFFSGLFVGLEVLAVKALELFAEPFYIECQLSDVGSDPQCAGVFVFVAAEWSIIAYLYAGMLSVW